MARTWFAAALVAAIPFLVQAAEPKSNDAAPRTKKEAKKQTGSEKNGGEQKELTPEELLAELVKEFNQAQKEFYKPFREAKTDEERRSIRLDFTKDPRRIFPEKFLALADEHAKTPAARDALVWVCRLRGGGGLDGRANLKKAIDRLLADHIDDKDLAQALPMLIYSPGLDAEEVFETVIEKSPHREVQGTATYLLAQSILRQGRYSGELPKQSEEKAIALLERVQSEFADVRHFRGNLGKAAEGDLFELRFLQIGKVAPEIEGEDVDGVEFKLTDYRGKVVVLDFWGDW